MSHALIQSVEETLNSIKSQGLYKDERPIESPQSTLVQTRVGEELKSLINLCANNYLGLANHPDLIEAAKQGLDSHGFWHGVRAVYLRHAGYSQATGETSK